MPLASRRCCVAPATGFSCFTGTAVSDSLIRYRANSSSPVWINHTRRGSGDDEFARYRARPRAVPLPGRVVDVPPEFAGRPQGRPARFSEVRPESSRLSCLAGVGIRQDSFTSSDGRDTGRTACRSHASPLLPPPVNNPLASCSVLVYTSDSGIVTCGVRPISGRPAPYPGTEETPEPARGAAQNPTGPRLIHGRGTRHQVKPGRVPRTGGGHPPSSRQRRTL